MHFLRVVLPVFGGVGDGCAALDALDGRAECACAGRAQKALRCVFERNFAAIFENVVRRGGSGGRCRLQDSGRGALRERGAARRVRAGRGSRIAETSSERLQNVSYIAVMRDGSETGFSPFFLGRSGRFAWGGMRPTRDFGRAFSPVGESVRARRKGRD